jgi:hypothetical protein
LKLARVEAPTMISAEPSYQPNAIEIIGSSSGICSPIHAAYIHVSIFLIPSILCCFKLAQVLCPCSAVSPLFPSLARHLTGPERARQSVFLGQLSFSHHLQAFPSLIFNWTCISGFPQLPRYTLGTCVLVFRHPFIGFRIFRVCGLESDLLSTAARV